jgi:hypothetical protein
MSHFELPLLHPAQWNLVRLRHARKQPEALMGLLHNLVTRTVTQPDQLMRS